MKFPFLDRHHEGRHTRNVSLCKRQDSNEPFSIAILERQEIHIQTKNTSYD